ncbi:DUF998 domain-containing protein [Paenibacillus crassostreae]|uniref:DUF998 domain-containing protein n=1 Tax=Paenibacillus crassostreae TaxID=1763538 RepID=A0A167FCL7_9BACL|nr:DUF998 domain-containing protein [Paenibacillus crassostreae]AOZ90822.1 hypothetical protein LPB68_00445 [Paenibacillus crassostreae]OAB76413.1 hypothetical protein PNBC_03090 [Paenibacillus crassostreae]
MKLFEKYTMPIGMIGAIAYILHTVIGNLLWTEYNPITMDISSLTAEGAPNTKLLKIFTSFYGVCSVLFVAGLIIKSFRKYHISVRIGYMIMMIMQLISLFGYYYFPLSGDKTDMNVQNVMHIVITVLVVFTTIASGFILAYGYLKYENMIRFGRFILVMAIIITITGATNPIGISRGLNVLGLTERLVIYSLQFLMFVISYYYTFSKIENDYDLKCVNALGAKPPRSRK